MTMINDRGGKKAYKNMLLSFSIILIDLPSTMVLNSSQPLMPALGLRYTYTSRNLPERRPSFVGPVRAPWPFSLEVSRSEKPVNGKGGKARVLKHREVACRQESRCLATSLYQNPAFPPPLWNLSNSWPRDLKKCPQLFLCLYFSIHSSFYSTNQEHFKSHNYQEQCPELSLNILIFVCVHMQRKHSNQCFSVSPVVLVSWSNRNIIHHNEGWGITFRSVCLWRSPCPAFLMAEVQEGHHCTLCQCPDF